MNQPFKSKRSLRRSIPTYQRFEPRTMLATLVGTEGDDTVSISVTGSTLDVDLNGDLQSFSHALDPQLDLDALAGSDTVTLESTDGSRIEFVDGVLKLGEFSVVFENVETVRVLNSSGGSGRILIQGTEGDDSVVFTSTDLNSSLSINGNEFELPHTETPLPLRFDSGAGDDELLLLLSHTGNFPRVTLQSFEASGQADLAWDGIEHIELEIVEGFDFFQLLANPDFDETLFIDEAQITLVGESATFESNRQDAFTSFWNPGANKNDVIVRGTDSDDSFDINYKNTRSLNYNDSSFIYLSDANLSIEGGDGNDSITFNLDEAEIGFVNEATIAPNSFQSTGFSEIVWSGIESRAAGNLNEVTLLDTNGDDTILVNNADITWSSGDFSWSLSDNENVEVTSAGGIDTATAISKPDGFLVSYYWRGLTSFEGGQQRFLAEGFSDVTVQGSGPGSRAQFFGYFEDPEIRLTDPEGMVLVEHGDFVPVKFQGELDLFIDGADDSTLNFESARDATEIQLQKNIISLNGNQIDLSDIIEVNAVGNSGSDSLRFVGTPEADVFRTGMLPDETVRTDKLTGSNYELSATGFVNVQVDLAEGDDQINFWGIEGEQETVSVGFIDNYTLASNNYRVDIYRGDFLTSDTVLNPLTFGFSSEDTLQFNGSDEYADAIVVVLSDADYNFAEWRISGNTYTDFSPDRRLYLEANGFTNVDFDLRGGEFAPFGEPIYQDWLMVQTLGSEFDEPTKYVTPNSFKVANRSINWTNVKQLGVNANGLGVVQGSELDDSITGPTEDFFFDGSFFPVHAVVVTNDDLTARYVFDDMEFASNGGNDSATLSTTANTVEFGIAELQAIISRPLRFGQATAEMGFRATGLSSINLLSEHEDDSAAFTFDADLDSANVRVADNEVEIASEIGGAVTSLTGFSSISLAGGGTDNVTFLTDTTTNGTTTVSANEALFTQINEADIQFPLAGIDNITMLAGSNIAPIIVNGSNEDDTVTLREQDFDLLGDSNSILVSGYGDAHIFGLAGENSAILKDDFDFESPGDPVILKNEHMTIALTDFGTLINDDQTDAKIDGTDGDDSFVVDYSGAQIVVTQSGSSERLVFSRNIDLRFNGKAGNDTITFIAPFAESVSTGLDHFSTNISTSSFTNFELLNHRGHNDASELTIDASEAWGSTYSVTDTALSWTDAGEQLIATSTGFDSFVVNRPDGDSAVVFRDQRSSGDVIADNNEIAFVDQFVVSVNAGNQLEIHDILTGGEIELVDSVDDDTLTIMTASVEHRSPSMTVLAAGYANTFSTSTGGDDTVLVIVDVESIQFTGSAFEVVQPLQSTTVQDFDSIDVSSLDDTPKLIGSDSDNQFFVELNQPNAATTVGGFDTKIVSQLSSPIEIDGTTGNNTVSVLSLADTDISLMDVSFTTDVSRISWTNVGIVNIAGHDDGSTVNIEATDDFANIFSVTDPHVELRSSQESYSISEFEYFDLSKIGSDSTIVIQDERTDGTTDASFAGIEFSDNIQVTAATVSTIHLIGNTNIDLTLHDSDSDDILGIEENRIRLADGNQTLFASDFESAHVLASSGDDLVSVEFADELIAGDGIVTIDGLTIENFDTIDLQALTVIPQIIGSEIDDTFTVNLSGSATQTSISSVNAVIVSSLNAAVSIDGAGGVNSITILAPNGETVSLADGSFGAGESSIAWSGFQNATFNGNNDGALVKIAADDLYANEIMVSNDFIHWIKGDETHTLFGFNQHELSKSGDNGGVKVIDQRLTGSVDASIDRIEFSNNVLFTSPTIGQIELTGSSNIDINLNDSAGNDVLTIRETNMELSDGSKSILVSNFGKTVATSTAGEDGVTIESVDTFEIGDGFFLIDGKSIQDFHIIEFEESAVLPKITGSAEDDRIFITYASELAGLAVLAVDGNETSILFDHGASIEIDGSGGTDDVTIVAPVDEPVTMGFGTFESTDGRAIQWNSIEAAMVIGNYDTGSVELIGTENDDLFRFSGEFAFLSSELGLISASKFSDIDVTAVDGNDTAYLSGDSTSANSFIGTSTFGRLTTQNSAIDVHGFDLVAALSKNSEDRASFVGTEADEQFFANHESARMVGDDFILNASGFNRVVAISNGGQDFANLTDSVGDDSLFAQPGLSRIIYSGGQTISVDGFATARSVSSSGDDQARFTGSNEDETFVASDKFGRLNGDGFSIIAVSYPSVRADGSGGNDISYLSDSIGDDFFFGSPTESFLSGDGFRNTVVGMESVIAFGSDGNDVATFNGSEGDDRFYGNPTVADLSSDGHFQFASGFDFVRAFGGGGDDTAVLRDSDEVDAFFGNSELAYLRNDNFHNEVRGFNSVKAVSVAGEDIATFEGSDGNELFHGHRDSSFLEGDGFRNQVNGFAVVNAIGLAGADLANLHDSDEDESFGGRENRAWLQGETYRLQVTDFENVNAFGFRGGTNRFFIDDPDFQWERFGTWDG